MTLLRMPIPSILSNANKMIIYDNRVFVFSTEYDNCKQTDIPFLFLPNIKFCQGV